MNKSRFLSISNSPNGGALQIAGLYLLVGGLWILFSDRVATRIALNEQMLTTISVYKGWGYVLITALLLYWLIRRHTAALLASEVKLQRVIDAMPAFISYVDVDRHYRFTNRTYKEWYDEQPEGKHIEEVIGKAAYQRVSKYIDQVLSGESVSYETAIPYQDTELFLAVKYIPDIAADGQVKGFFVLAQDRTAQRQAEEEQQLWADAFEGCYHGIAIGDPHTNRIMVCNPAFAGMLKRSVEEVVGSAILSLYAPSDHEQVRRHIEKADQIGYVRYEAQMIRKDGSLFPVQMDIVSVLGEDGELLHRVATAQDISERKAIDEKLKASETKYRTLAEHLPAITYISEPDAYVGVSYISPQIESLGFDRNTWLADPELWFRQIHPDDQERVKSELQKFEAGAESFRAEYRLNLPDGQERWFHDESIRVRDQSGKTILKQGFMLDLTESKQAEEVLQESEERYRIVSELTSDYAYRDRVEADGSIIPEWITDSFTRITGYALEETFAPDFWQRLVHPEHLQILLEHIQILLSGQPDTKEFRIITKSGQERWLRDYSNPVWDATQERVVKLYGAVQDVTERKRAEDALQKSQHLLLDVIDNSSALIYLLDFEGRFLMINRSLESVLGRPREELIGKPRDAVLPPEIAAKHRANDVEVIETRLPMTMEEETNESDGRHVYLSNKFPLLDQSGNLYGVGGISTDITQRKQAEEVLHNQQAQTTGILNSAMDAIISTDADQRILIFNPAAETMFQCNQSEAIGQPLDRFIPERFREAHRQYIHNYGQTGVTNRAMKGSAVVFGRRNNGDEFPCEASISQIDIAGKKMYTVILRDVTERKQAEEALRESEQKFSIIYYKAPFAAALSKLPNGVIVDVNEAFEKVFGYTKQEAIGKTSLELGINPDSESWARIIRELQELGSVRDVELTLLTKSGVARYFLMNIDLVGIGEEKYVFQTVQDITERRQAEEYLRRFELLSEHSRDIILFMGRGDGRILEANAAAVQAYGYSREELLSLTIRDLRAGDSQALTAEQMAQADAGGILFETTHRRKDGSAFPVEVSSQGATIGGVRTLISIVRDITQRRQAEEELERTNQKLNEILVSIQDDFYVLDRDWNFVYASRLFTAKVGKEPQDLVGKNIWTMFPKHAGTALEENFRAAMERREIRRFEIGGKYTTAWYRMTAFPSAEGITVIGTDITKLRQAEEALQLKDQLLRLTSEIAKVGGWEFDAETGKGTWTDEVARIHDLDPAQETNIEIGVSFYEGESREKVEQAIKEAIEHAKPYDLELKMVTAKGNQKWVRTMALPIVEDGKVVKVQGIFQDITERKQIEKALQMAHDELELKVQERTAALSESNALLQAMMDNMPDQIYFKDLQGHFIRNSRSQANLLGLDDPAQAVGKTDFDFFPHATRANAEEQEVMRSGKPLVDLEEWVVWPDGREMWVSTTKVPLRNAEGETIGIFGISHDITERKQAEQAIRQLNVDLEKQADQLKAANKELEAFSYSVSHDLRAPLRAIDGYTRILVEDYESILDAEGKRVCGIIGREARRMGQLIDDLLAFSRLGRKEMHTSKIDMRVLAVSVLNDILKEADRERIDFQIGRLPAVRGDSSLIRQVWANLLANAIKFTSRKERAVIEVGSKTNNDELIYYVRDSGAGFDMEYANKLFGVFQRLHSESEFDGTGVGLAIVQRIVHRHEGRVWAEGEVGKGATFYFSLPRKEHHHE